jgi:hypothetical protein
VAALTGQCFVSLIKCEQCGGKVCEGGGEVGGVAVGVVGGQGTAELLLELAEWVKSRGVVFRGCRVIFCSCQALSAGTSLVDTYRWPTAPTLGPRRPSQ